MDKFYEWIAYKLPKRLVYFAAIRLMAYGTTGEYSYTSVTHVRMMTVLKRWGDKYGA